MNQSHPHPELYNVPYYLDEFQGMPYCWMGRSGLRASVVGLGTWKFGYPETGDGSRVDERTAMAIFDRAIELGVTFWDTANRYNNASGNSERLIGKWLKANPDQRRNVVIATKMFGGMDGFTPNHCRLSRGNILDSVYASLARMQIDHIDLLYFHAYEPITPVEESLLAIEDLVSRDMVRYLGVSNVSVDALRLFQAAGAALSARCRVVAVQNGFDILHGEANPDQRGVMEHCYRTGVSYVAYSPLARGLLTGRYLDLSKVGRGDRVFDEGTLTEDVAGGIMDRLHRLAALARAWDLELSQLALAFTLTLPGMGPVIPGASSLAQLEANASVAKITLSRDQREQVAAIVGLPT